MTRPTKHYGEHGPAKYYDFSGGEWWVFDDAHPRDGWHRIPGSEVPPEVVAHWAGAASNGTPP